MPSQATNVPPQQVPRATPTTPILPLRQVPLFRAKTKDRRKTRRKTEAIKREQQEDEQIRQTETDTKTHEMLRQLIELQMKEMKDREQEKEKKRNEMEATEMEKKKQEAEKEDKRKQELEKEKEEQVLKKEKKKQELEKEKRKQELEKDGNNTETRYEVNTPPYFTHPRAPKYERSGYNYNSTENKNPMEKTGAEILRDTLKGSSFARHTQDWTQNKFIQVLSTWILLEDFRWIDPASSQWVPYRLKLRTENGTFITQQFLVEYYKEAIAHLFAPNTVSFLSARQPLDQNENRISMRLGQRTFYSPWILAAFLFVESLLIAFAKKYPDLLNGKDHHHRHLDERNFWPFSRMPLINKWIKHLCYFLDYVYEQTHDPKVLKFKDQVKKMLTLLTKPCFGFPAGSPDPLPDTEDNYLLYMGRPTFVSHTKWTNEQVMDDKYKRHARGHSKK